MTASIKSLAAAVTLTSNPLCERCPNQPSPSYGGGIGECVMEMNVMGSCVAGGYAVIV